LQQTQQKIGLTSNFIHLQKKGELLPYRQFVQAFAWDNPNYPESSLKSLKEMPDGPEKERLYYGNWEFSDDPTALCDYDAVTDVFTNEVRGNGHEVNKCRPCDAGQG
jgi:phage terminase large subunit